MYLAVDLFREIGAIAVQNDLGELILQDKL